MCLNAWLGPSLVSVKLRKGPLTALNQHGYYDRLVTAYQRQQLEEGSDLAARLPLWVEHLRHFPGLRPSAAAAAAGLGGSVVGSPAGNWFLSATLHYTVR